ncbi:MAG: hypothetical protein BIFFINMI_01301 [Phycisphaerae bacterium]|nr:hypothetical protein [Phycisphaerae bacterium]
MSRTLLPLLAAVIAAAAPLPLARAGLTADQIAIVYGKQDAQSAALARHYAGKRGVPEAQMLGLDFQGETISRNDYDRKLAGPIRDWLTESKLKDKVRCLLLIRPLPYRVLGSAAPPAVLGYLADVDKDYKSAVQMLEQTRWALEQLAAGTIPKDLPPRQEKLSSSAVLKGLDAISGKAAAAVGAMPDGPAKTQAAGMLYRLWDLAYGPAGVTALAAGRGNPPPPPDVDLAAAKKRDQEARAALAAVPADATREQLVEKFNLAGKTAGLSGQVRSADRDRGQAASSGERAAVDSELSLLWSKEYRLAGGMPNPLNWRYAARPQPDTAPTLMVFRLDGADFDTLTRLVDDSLATEKAGLTGRVYLDLARKGGGYAGYDRDLEKLADLLKQTRLPVTVESTAKLMPAGSGPDCALYCGWYSLRKFVPSVAFKTGAVGWHIASFELQDLRAAKPTTWVPNLIRNGDVATFGSFDEPYLGAFPLPSQFFGLLLTGRYTMAEVFYLTNPQLSWMMSFIGDPLYAPFKADPQLKPSDLPWFHEPEWVK